MFCDIENGVLTIKPALGVEAYALAQWTKEGSKVKVLGFDAPKGVDGLVRSTVGATIEDTVEDSDAGGDVDEREAIIDELKALGVTKIKKGTRTTTLKVMLDNAKADQGTPPELAGLPPVEETEETAEDTSEDMFGLDDTAPVEEPAKPEPVKAAKPAPKPAAKAEPAKPTKPATIEDCRSALMSYAKATSGPDARALLGKFNVTSVSKLKPEQYPEVIAACVKGLK